MDEEPEIPNSARFWRLNEIEGLKMMLQFRDRSTAQDPEELEEIIKNQARLEELREQESRVIARFERMTGRNLVEEWKEQAEVERQANRPAPIDWQTIPTEDLDLPF